MAEFKVGERIETADNKIEVTVGPNTQLAVGEHRFQLVVVDDDGNESEPFFTRVLVKALDRPTAHVEALPAEVEFGKPFTLSGARSRDISGKIVKYIWTRIS
jgi:hypothetical protein